MGDAALDAAQREQARLRPVTLPGGARAVGRALGELALHGARIVQVHRAEGQVLAPDDELTLAAGDTVVLSGGNEALALAEDALLGGA